MELTDLKTEIHQLVDGLPESQLVELRELLQKQQKSALSSEEQKLVRKIFSEDRGLLQRLAQ